MPEAAICVQDIDVQCVLQFTLIHAAGCALHRHTSRVIHRLELSFAFLFSLTARRVAPPRSSNESRTGIDAARTSPARRQRPSESSKLLRVVKVERCVDDDGWAIATSDFVKPGKERAPLARREPSEIGTREDRCSYAARTTPGQSDDARRAGA